MYLLLAACGKWKDSAWWIYVQYGLFYHNLNLFTLLVGSVADPHHLQVDSDSRLAM